MEIDDKISKLQKLKDKNRVRFKWQDAVLNIIEDLHLPRYVQTNKDKDPLDVRAILMSHARRNLPVLERRFALVKEQGKAGDEAFLYYLGIIEKENVKQ
ncbi:MAG: hypothetical protein A3J48_01615 [Candidatus Doudnabacteria bacterium RIFCSPHIGHO2_02_FULL_46_11]|uniref:Uncharacterized protein n=1 Tax=Candidatus Doudnabacteria bacterium RIFCSPHIGHO2_02_FULL_46_11 TaxID=1817832 RepID=A0A1F5PAD2_9BACT|nr:MAG: hypothetical protein A3J48_01615 [Candidatus Doudnabacteria bacterium RIFCSPHIGHO2_02_FULL_46_11]